jgi:hypothetical protein
VCLLGKVTNENSQNFQSTTDAKIERRLISATTGAIFNPRVALSGSDTQGLNATLAMKIAPVTSGC